MDDKKRLPDAELAVMQAVWAQEGEVSRGDLDGALASHGWSANTVTPTLLACAKKDSSRAAARGGTICTRRSSQRTDTSNLRAAAS